MSRLALGVMFLVSLAMLVVGQRANGQGTAPSADAGKKAFAQCAACHAVTPGTNRVGPSLHKIVGRKIAASPGYAYSPALKAKGGAWTEAALDAYLASPQGFAKGTKMVYPGQKDAARRAALIAYLKTL